MKEFLLNQYKNLFLWVPFLMAGGAGLYFSLETEPSIKYPIIITILIAATIYKCKNVFVRGNLLFIFGFFYAMTFTHCLNTPQIKNSFGEIHILGTIKNIDYAPNTTYITLKTKSINNQYANIRFSLKDTKTKFQINDTVNGKATVFHPATKYVPDSFDFARWAYFNNLSATGFLNSYTITKSNSNKDNIRNYIHNKTKSPLSDALVLGFKKTLPEKESNIWKSVGLGHVWSISGFHMTLVGGWLFALFYLIFRSISYITKRVPAKYPAIICSWFGLIFYLCLSGISVATIRAFLMATFVFIATLFGRSILNLRNAAIVFLILFFINPFFVMNAGFQLSFAAIFGLLWFFKDAKYTKKNTIKTILHYIKTSFQTAFIATIFTLPFIIAHFGYIPTYSLIGNIIILPIFSFAIMPLVMIGTICALFNNFYFLNLSNDIYNFALSIAERITNLPHANFYIPYISNTVLILSIIGMLFIILFERFNTKNFFIRNVNYLIASIIIISSIIICVSTPSPLFYTTSDHELAGFVENGKLKFNRSKSSKHYFAFDSWREFNNEKPSLINEKYKCKKGFCIYKTSNWNLAYMQNFTAIMNNINEICKDKKINYIVATFDINAPNCNAKILKDGLVIYPDGHIIKILNHRPWHI